MTRPKTQPISPLSSSFLLASRLLGFLKKASIPLLLLATFACQKEHRDPTDPSFSSSSWEPTAKATSAAPDTKTSPPETLSTPEHQAEIDAWHDGRIQRLKSEDGWLTLAGLGWLAEGDNLAGSHPEATVQLPAGAPERVGVFRMKDGEVRFVPEPGIKLSLNGEPGRSAPTPPLKSSRGQKPDVLGLGTYRLHLMDMLTRKGIRVRDTQAPLRFEFQGVERFPVDAKWRKTARWVPASKGESMPIPNALGEAFDEPLSGRAYFEHEGDEHSLVATWDNGRLFFAFADQSNRKSTYPPGRFVSAAPPEAGEKEIVLDFNRAYNPPCAFTKWATCPRPVKENRLPFEVLAGEMAWAPDSAGSGE